MDIENLLMKKYFVFVLTFIFSLSLSAQLSLTKMVGKDAHKYRLGYDLFFSMNFT